jgi:hypothetical protein
VIDDHQPLLIGANRYLLCNCQIIIGSACRKRFCSGGALSGTGSGAEGTASKSICTCSPLNDRISSITEVRKRRSMSSRDIGLASVAFGMMSSDRKARLTAPRTRLKSDSIGKTNLVFGRMDIDMSLVPGRAPKTKHAAEIDRGV